MEEALRARSGHTRAHWWPEAAAIVALVGSQALVVTPAVVWAAAALAVGGMFVKIAYLVFYLLYLLLYCLAGHGGATD